MENEFSEIISNSLEKIKQFADTETVIGQPITTPGGTTVIPVSKVSMGLATGALGSKPKEKESKSPKIGGGGGTGISVTPIAFLVISESGKVDLIPVSAPTNDATIDKVTNIIERSPDILERLKKVFVSTKKKIKNEETVEEPKETEN